MCPPRLILAELKTEHGKLTHPQQHWLELLPVPRHRGGSVAAV
ncbi:MAG: hypothetical protein ACRDGJ_04880 [Candidatus Limnocylindria bacterium]